MSEQTVYLVYKDSAGDWCVITKDDETILGKRPKKEPAKRLAQQHAGRRTLAWTYNGHNCTYTSN